jgi:hypothetical protein
VKRYSLFSKAIYYELLGQKDKALVSYVDMLKKDPNSQKARVSLRRLSGTHIKFAGLNEKKILSFKKLENDNDFMEFEKWLLK